MKNYLSAGIAIFLIGLQSCAAQTQATDPSLTEVPGLGKIRINPNHTWEKVESAKSATGNECDSMLLTKILNNRGAGEDYLGGVRNMRPVLRGVMYRGGGNNKYNPIARRHNNNPLSYPALLSLSEYGFTEAVYLYNKNFSHYFTPEMLNQLEANNIHYQSLVPDNDSLATELLTMIHRHIKEPEKGAVYLHCWNGWHMSGLISAYALIQFCNYTNAEALRYWQLGTDNNHKGYAHVKTRIQKFKPLPALQITEQEKERVCPCTK